MLRIFHLIFLVVLLSCHRGAIGASIRGSKRDFEITAVFGDAADEFEIGDGDFKVDVNNVNRFMILDNTRTTGLKKRDLSKDCDETCPLAEAPDPYKWYDYWIYGIKDWYLNTFNKNSDKIRNLFEQSRKDIREALKEKGQLDMVSLEASTYALWMYRTTRHYTAETAKAFGDAHERTEEISRGERVKKLRNLCVGRCLANKERGKDDVDVIVRALLDGMLQIKDYHGTNISIVSRTEWEARSTSLTKLDKTKVNKVIIHHTVGKHCTSEEACKAEVKSIQYDHMNNRGWSDIGYNFLIGEDGNVYEGRGWNFMGAHATPQNAFSYGVSVMGNFNEKTPNYKALQTTKDLIELGIDEGYIPDDYILRGHRDFKKKDCPGHLLYEEIGGWPNFSNHRKFCSLIKFRTTRKRKPTSQNSPVPSKVSTVVFMESGNQKLAGDAGTTGEATGISFSIDFSGNVYEELGWDYFPAGANVYTFNFFGNFVCSKPTETALSVAQDLISCGQEDNHITTEGLVLKDHGSIRDPENNNLYKRIKDFPKFQET
ncbi:peptidoglycan-recognition protein LF-like [Ptychodera flava]|uniref:peptidoglycan-recognition protein LF-like n=1 Tax=Ptychodera flava TaxID=63121 RepID=UPI00396A9F05